MSVDPYGKELDDHLQYQFQTDEHEHEGGID